MKLIKNNKSLNKVCCIIYFEAFTLLALGYSKGIQCAQRIEDNVGCYMNRQVQQMSYLSIITDPGFALCISFVSL